MDASALFDSLSQAEAYPIAPSDAFDARYALLPPPPPIYLSGLTPAGQRGRLPDFDSTPFPAVAARAWARRMFFFHLERAWPHLYFTTACIALLVLIVGAIWARRIWERSWWLLRVVKKPNGTLIVPNSLITYTTCTGAFGVLLIAWIWELYEWNVNDQRPALWVPWILLVWTPLFSAVHLASWGLFHSLPNVFTTSASGDVSAKHRSWVFRCMTRPATLNFLGGILPFFQALSVIAPTIVAHVQYMRALNEYYRWEREYANATQVDQQMLQDVQRIWYTFLDSAKIMSIVFLIWTIWAVMLFVVWSILNYRLMNVISAQLKHVRQLGRRQAEQAATIQARKQATSVAPEQPADRGADEAGQDLGGRGVMFGSKADDVIKEEYDGTFNKTESDALASDHGDAALNGKEDPVSPVGNGDSDVEGQHRWRTRLRGGLPPYSRRGSALLPNARGESEEDENFTAAQIAADEPTTTFFPPVRPSRIVRRQAPRVHGRTSQGNTKAQRYLRSVLIHVAIQAVAVTPAILGFASLACWLCVQTYNSFENADLHFDRTASTALIWMAWMANIGGTITLVAIAQRTYEPVLHFGLAHAGGSGSHSSGAKRQAAKSLEGSKGSKGRRMRNGRPISRIINAGSRSNENDDAPADNGYGVTYTTFFESETIQRPAKSFPHGGSDLRRNESVSSYGSAVNRSAGNEDAQMQRSESRDRAAAAAVGLGIGTAGSMPSFNQRSPVQPANKKSIARFAATPLPATPSQVHADGARARQGSHSQDAQEGTELRDMSPRSASAPRSPRDLPVHTGRHGPSSSNASLSRTGSSGTKYASRADPRSQSPVLQVQRTVDTHTAMRSADPQHGRRQRGSGSLELNTEGGDVNTSDDDADGTSYWGSRRPSNPSTDALGQHAGSRYFASERRSSAASRTAGSSSGHAPNLSGAPYVVGGASAPRSKHIATLAQRPGSSSSRLSDVNDPPAPLQTGLVPAPRRRAPGRPSSARRVPSSDSASQLHASSPHPLSPTSVPGVPEHPSGSVQDVPGRDISTLEPVSQVARQAPHSSPTFGLLTPHDAASENTAEHPRSDHSRYSPTSVAGSESAAGYAQAY